MAHLGDDGETVRLVITAGDWVEVSDGIPIGYLTNEGPEWVKFMVAETKPEYEKTLGHTLFARAGIQYAVSFPNKLWVAAFKERNYISITPGSIYDAFDNGSLPDGSDAVVFDSDDANHPNVITKGFPISALTPTSMIQLLGATFDRELKVSSEENIGLLTKIFKELRIMNFQLGKMNDNHITYEDIGD